MVKKETRDTGAVEPEKSSRLTETGDGDNLGDTSGKIDRSRWVETHYNDTGVARFYEPKPATPGAKVRRRLAVSEVPDKTVVAGAPYRKESVELLEYAAARILVEKWVPGERGNREKLIAWIDQWLVNTDRRPLSDRAIGNHVDKIIEHFNALKGQ